VIDDPGRPEDGLFARDEDGKPLVVDRRRGKAVREGPGVSPTLTGRGTCRTGAAPGRSSS
jgi:hypothetical protein